MHLKSQSGPINVLVLNRDDSSVCTMQTMPPQSQPSSATTSAQLEGATVTTESVSDRGVLQAKGPENKPVDDTPQASGDAGAGTLSLEELIKNVVADSMRQSDENNKDQEQLVTCQRDDVIKEGEIPMDVDTEDPVPKPQTDTAMAALEHSHTNNASKQETCELIVMPV